MPRQSIFHEWVSLATSNPLAKWMRGKKKEHVPIRAFYLASGIPLCFRETKPKAVKEVLHRIGSKATPS